MPLPTPHAGEEESKFIERCMHAMAETDPDRPQDQRLAICYSQYKKGDKGLNPEMVRYRELALQKKFLDREKRLVRLSFSSDQPYLRENGYEILSHAKGALNTDRLKSGLALLVNHNWEDQLGVVTDYSVDGHKAFATVKISRSVRGEELLNDIEDGIKRSVSVGYSIDKIRQLKDEELDSYFAKDNGEMHPMESEMGGEDSGEDDEDEEDEEDEDEAEEEDDYRALARARGAYLVTRFTPLEISVVSVPADISVGVGRSKEVAPAPAVSIENPIRESMAETNVVEITSETLNEARRLEVARIRELTGIGKRFGAEKEADDFVNQDKTVAEFNAYILEHKIKTQNVIPTPPTGAVPNRDMARYDLCKAIMEGGEHRLSGLELEIDQEMSRVNRKSRPDSFWLPEQAFGYALRNTPLGRLATRDAVVGTPGLGGDLVQTTVVPSLIELLRHKMVLGRAGATMMSGLRDNLAIPGQITAATATWATEVQALTNTDRTFNQVPLEPIRLGAVSNFSKMLLAQSVLSIQAIIAEDLLTVIALAEDEAGLFGTAPAPVGIFNYPANTPTGNVYQQTAASVTFPSGYPTWTNIVAFEGNVGFLDVNLDDPSARYIINPKTMAAWKTYARTDPRATNQFYPAFFIDQDNEVNGYPYIASNQIGPTNQVLFGVFSNVIIGHWGGGVELFTDPYTLAHQAEVRIVINLFTDIAFRYTQAFAYSTNSGITN
jgi:HK97 family phage major capsid protein